MTRNDLIQRIEGVNAVLSRMTSSISRVAYTGNRLEFTVDGEIETYTVNDDFDNAWLAVESMI